MFLHHLRKISLLIILLTIILLPLSAFSAEEEAEGTITINIVDENGDDFVGSWKLHHGTTKNGLVVRNGTSGETFKVEPGNYFLEAYSLWQTGYNYRLISSENHQALSANETITFNVQYFSEENDYIIASGGEVDEPKSKEVEESEIIRDEFGCNRTAGYVWCERTQKCTMPWTKTCQVTKPNEATKEKPTVVTPPLPPQLIKRTVDPDRTYMGPATNNLASQNVPTDTTTASSANTGYQLAETGPANLLLLLVPSLISGLIYTRRKRS